MLRAMLPVGEAANDATAWHALGGGEPSARGEMPCSKKESLGQRISKLSAGLQCGVHVVRVEASGLQRMDLRDPAAKRTQRGHIHNIYNGESWTRTPKRREQIAEQQQKRIGQVVAAPGEPMQRRGGEVQVVVRRMGTKDALEMQDGFAQQQRPA